MLVLEVLLEMLPVTMVLPTAANGQAIPRMVLSAIPLSTSEHVLSLVLVCMVPVSSGQLLLGVVPFTRFNSTSSRVSSYSADRLQVSTLSSVSRAIRCATVGVVP